MGVPRVLTVAGSDSCGGAGIQADIKTISALGGHAMTVVTALTAQDTIDVKSIYEIPPDFVAAQFNAVVVDIGVDAIKTGMLFAAPIIEVVADRIRHFQIEPVVVDPVLTASGGTNLLAKEARESLCRELFPLAFLVTPNVPEAEVLSDVVISSPSDMKVAARIIYEMGPRFVLIKGGHLISGHVHMFYDGHTFREIPYRRLDTEDTHGSGCTLSAAIATEIARGRDVLEAITIAESFVNKAICHALRLGKGRGFLNQFAL
ncbi:MAG TPA: bifunctional hydroxymethylpyrimidine kinase/phosphomethylpyrimidine kinase [Syntrophales bacterium]|nr:bifunctional hydroxymethylpyrimidine kinase/phosphomethylpyrimidine kinase [Syntrophales bacterium]HOL58432.1 bifunctional hydroxymethylpyrimidine kinase/phosphomethylpyrimidine kinase [Syntrophales bacterium]HPO34601.1 bifunctional hydroxymethylpyrimidine kinase/phosphomethylpyrimidine kinase [Syntrophales bacterium]